MKLIVGFIVGVISAPLLLFALNLTVDLIGLCLRAVYDTQTLMRGQWRLWRYAPGIFTDRYGKQWKAWRGGYEITAINLRMPQ